MIAGAADAVTPSGAIGRVVADAVAGASAGVRPASRGLPSCRWSWRWWSGSPADLAGATGRRFETIEAPAATPSSVHGAATAPATPSVRVEEPEVIGERNLPSPAADAAARPAAPAPPPSAPLRPAAAPAEASRPTQVAARATGDTVDAAGRAGARGRPRARPHAAGAARHAVARRPRHASSAKGSSPTSGASR